MIHEMAWLARCALILKPRALLLIEFYSNFTLHLEQRMDLAEENALDLFAELF